MSDSRVVLVDMDGPLAAFDAHFHELCTTQGWAMHSTLDTQCHRFATDCIVDREHARLARQHVDSTAWFRDLPVVPGAVEGLDAIAELADVWICTKPLEANATCRDDKAAWLADHFGERWVRRLILAPDKSMVRGNVLLDDAPKPEWFDAASWRPVIFPMPWNGKGSVFDASLQRWAWGDPVDELVYGPRWERL